jgi:hypothetical protein
MDFFLDKIESQPGEANQSQKNNDDKSVEHDLISWPLFVLQTLLKVFNHILES